MDFEEFSFGGSASLEDNLFDFIGEDLSLPDFAVGGVTGVASAADISGEGTFSALVKEEPNSPGHSSDFSDFSEPSSPDSMLSMESAGGLYLENYQQQQPKQQPISPNKRTSLKRPRESPTPTLSADQMRKLSAGASPETALGLKKLSPEEERQIKRQRRLIKNRESAQKSRQRKKMYVEELEHKVATLVAENERLQQENKGLREDVTYLTNVIKKTPGIPQEVLNKRISVASPTSVKAAGVCLLIVLFSFGLFFNAKPAGPSLRFEPNMPREAIPEVVPGRATKRYSGQMLKSFRDSEVEGERELLEIFPDRGNRRVQSAMAVSEDLSAHSAASDSHAQHFSPAVRGGKAGRLVEEPVANNTMGAEELEGEQDEMELSASGYPGGTPQGPSVINKQKKFTGNTPTVKVEPQDDDLFQPVANNTISVGSF